MGGATMGRYTAFVNNFSRPPLQELREWFTEYQVARRAGRNVENLWRDEKRFEDAVDFKDLEQMSHAYGKD
jgi:hypothetical protein